MDSRTVIERLRAHRAVLESQGIAHISLFGSTARGDAGPESDIDLAVELAHDARIGGFEFVRLQSQLAALLERPVDLVALPARNPRIGAEIARDQIVAF